MKRTTITLIITACAASLFAQDATPLEPAPSSSPPPAIATPTPVASPQPTMGTTGPASAVANTQPAATPPPWIATNLPPWLFAEGTTAGVPPGADPSTTILRSKFEPVIIRQGQYYLIVFHW